MRRVCPCSASAAASVHACTFHVQLIAQWQSTGIASGTSTLAFCCQKGSYCTSGIHWSCAAATTWGRVACAAPDIAPETDKLMVSTLCLQLPKLLELVGLGYTAWFTYRYLLFKVRSPLR